MTADEILIEYHAHRAATGQTEGEVVNEEFQAEAAAFLADDIEDFEDVQ